MTANISTGWLFAISIAIIWDIVWRGVALWQASKRNEKWWFIFLLVLSTVGILPIIYLLIERERHPSVIHHSAQPV